MLQIKRMDRWRAFNICALLLWNKLPLELRKSKSLDIFKRNFKTQLFKKDFTLFIYHLNTRHIYSSLSVI